MASTIQMKVEIVDIDELNETIFAFANGDFDRRLKLSDHGEDRNTIVSGINMLGEELKETTVSRDYFASIYNAVSELLLITDTKGVITNANQSALKALGFSKEALVGTPIESILLSSEKSFVKKVSTVLKSGKKNHAFESAFKTKRKKTIPVSCSAAAIINKFDAPQGYLIIARDITERIKRKSREMRIISLTQERERRRVSTDLHDSLGQELSAIKMYMHSLVFFDKNSPDYQKSFDLCKNLIDGSLEVLRGICFQLMPKSLETGGLFPALIELGAKINPILPISYSFPTGKTNISSENKMLIYRVIQEFISNSLKHSKASGLYIHATVKSKIITFQLKDDGKGFDTESPSKGSGLFNMKSRLEALGADYTLKSAKNKGTKLTFSVSEE